MNDINSLLSRALSQIELKELQLLTWGLTDAAFSERELDEVLDEAIASTYLDDGKHFTCNEVKDALLERALVVSTPTGGYRSRMAETTRLLSKLRQTFRNQQSWEGSPLVLDYKLLVRPRRRPKREISNSTLTKALNDSIGGVLSRLISKIAPLTVSTFQLNATQTILNQSSGKYDTAVMVSAGTGAGKTLAFYLPILGLVSEIILKNSGSGVKCVSIYPRGELLKDQFKALLTHTLKIGAIPESRSIRIGAWFGQVPETAKSLNIRNESNYGWTPKRSNGKLVGWICPFLVCPHCEGALIWKEENISKGVENLQCRNESCGEQISDEFITLTRKRSIESPPDFMFTTAESLNRQLSYPGNQYAFGLRGTKARFVLLDEVHTYEGISGAQNALLMRRVRKAIGQRVLWVGLSATLEDAASFLSKFTGVLSDRVLSVEVKEKELEESGTEYMLALRNNPAFRTGILSTTIQTVMALSRTLDTKGSVYLGPAPDSGGLYGKKTFVFTDKLDVTNRLYWDLLDAEGWWKPGTSRNYVPLSLAHLRAEIQDRRSADKRENSEDRDYSGQWWWLAEYLGRDLIGDQQLAIGRTSSQDSGVDSNAEVLVATASLEVGYDDDAVGAVVQHKAPHDSARFLQRKGRAGRNPIMRPWTVVVLSNWGRDRVAWQLYEEMFDPTLKQRSLPLKNRYVLKMQAVYSTLDWLAERLHTTLGLKGSSWSDLSAPTEITAKTAGARSNGESRQKALIGILQEILDAGPALDHYKAHLRKSLGWLDADEIDLLLWSAPRPIMLTVLPTALKRLKTNWRREDISKDDINVRMRIPLREFIAGNLFDDLLVPEVEVLVPISIDSNEVKNSHIPMVRTFRELMPGNITQHFGVDTMSRRHWVPLDDLDCDSHVFNVHEVYAATYLTSLPDANSPSGVIDLYRPEKLTLKIPTLEISSSSSVSPIWQFHVEDDDVGETLPKFDGRWTNIFSDVTFFMHATGAGVTERRYVLSAEGQIIKRNKDPKFVQIEFSASNNLSGNRVGLGLEIAVDAIKLEVKIPLGNLAPRKGERSLFLRDLFREDLSLPQNLTWFDRDKIVSGVILFAARFSRDVDHNPCEDLSDHELSNELRSSLKMLGVFQDTVHDDSRSVSPNSQGDSDSLRSQDSDLSNVSDNLEGWLRDKAVLASIRKWSLIALAGRNQDWIDWRARRISSALAGIFVEASSAICSDLDSDELAIDVIPLPGEDGNIIWISELSPGGNGQVEALYKEISEKPSKFRQLLDATLEKTDIEMLDQQIREFLLLVSNDKDVESECLSVQHSWNKDHQAVANSFNSLKNLIQGRGRQFSKVAWSTIANRLLGPGSTPGLLDGVSQLLSRWDLLEEKSGFELSAIEFGATVTEVSSIDEFMHLGVNPTGNKRSQVLGSFFWPRGDSSSQSASDISNPFGSLPSPDKEAVRTILGVKSHDLFITEFNEGIRQEIHLLLSENGEVTLKCELNFQSKIRNIILSFQENPVDLGSIFYYPKVTSLIKHTSGVFEITLSVMD